MVSNPLEENPLWRAEKVDNYLGLPGLSGAEMLAAMRRHAEQAGVEFLAGKVLNAVQMPDAWYVSVGPDMYNARAVVLAAGVARGKKFAGEAELLGRGVSYCATCDGMLYRGKPVAVVGYTDTAGWSPSPATAGPFRRRACSSCGPPWPPRSCSRGWRWNRAM